MPTTTVGGSPDCNKIYDAAIRISSCEEITVAEKKRIDSILTMFRSDCTASAKDLTFFDANFVQNLYQKHFGPKTRETFGGHRV